MRRLILSLVIVAVWAGAAAAQPGGGGGTYIFNPTVPSGVSTTLAAGYVKSSGTTLSSQAVPIPVVDGGTGQTIYTVGDLLQAVTATSIAGLAGVATGNAVISGGIGVSSTYGKIGLTTHVSGITPTANGGTGIAFFTAAGPTVARVYTFPDAAATVLTTNAAVTVAQGGTSVGTFPLNGVLYGNSTTSVLATAQGAANTVLVANAGAPSFTASPTIGTSLTMGTSSAASGIIRLPNNQYIIGRNVGDTADSILVGIGTVDDVVLGSDTITSVINIRAANTVTLRTGSTDRLTVGSTGIVTLNVPLAVPSGGLGVATLAANGVLYGNTAGVVLVTAQGAANSVLVANAGAPSFSVAPTLGTSLTTPLLVGGTAVSSTLTLKSTSGVGSSDAIIFQVGNNGATEGMRITTAGLTGLGVTPVADARLQVAGHIHSTGTTPTVGTCGTTPSITGTDISASVTTGGTATTSCTVTFGVAFATAPVCVATFTSQTAAIRVEPQTNNVLFTYASATGSAFNYVCIGKG